MIAKAIRHVPVQKYLEHRATMLAGLGKAPDGKPLKKSADGGGKNMKANSAAPKKKTTRKKAAAKRG